VLETNLDDVTGEQLGHAVAAALAAGALDAWVSAVTMKKGRPGHVLHVLTDVAHLDALRHLIHTTTGTFGVRAVPVERWPAARTLGEVTVEGRVVQMKVGYGRAKPEFEDVVSVAAASGVDVREVASRAEEAWRQAQHGTAAPPDGEEGGDDGHPGPAPDGA
jgi:pyridinium-3,5-bisthiocarboxylic acid mononucleotide nickel chelatase